MKRTLLAIILITGVFATQATGSWVSDGKYAAEFLSLGVDARALGMGGAYVALTDGASAVYWNPAGLAHQTAHQVSLMHAEQFDGIVGYDYLGYGWPRSGESGWGFGLIRLGVDDIPITALEDPTQPLGAGNRVVVADMTSDNEMAFFAGLGKQHSRVLSYGLAAKILGKFVADYTAFGIGFDVGLRLQPGKNIAFGAVFQDVTTTALIWDTGHKEAVAPTLKLGGAYQLDLPTLLARLTLAADVDLRFTDRGEADQFQFGAVTADTHVGLEYLLDIAGTNLALRGGAEPSREQDEEGFFGNYTFGAGLLFRSLHIDYAFLAHPELGDTHRISLSVLWGHRGNAAAAEGAQ